MKIENPKIILLHPGKTGGTSLEHTIKDKYIDPSYNLDSQKENKELMFGLNRQLNIYLQHACLNLYKDLNINVKEYKTICTVRRPYERILSCYFYNGKSNHFTFEEFVTKKLEENFTNSIKNKYASGHFAPQFYYTHLDDYVVDHIIKLENFNEDCLSAGINVKYHYSKTEGTKQYKDYMDAYNQKTKDIVYKIYKDDFEMLDYEKD